MSEINVVLSWDIPQPIESNYLWSGECIMCPPLELFLPGEEEGILEGQYVET